MKFKIPSALLALVACLLWSTAFVGVKYAIGFAPPLFIAGIRFTLAGLILIPFASSKGYLKEVKKHYKIIITVGLLQTFCVYLLFFLALVRIKASTGAALVGVGPLAGALMGYLFIKSEKFTRKKIISFALGIIGVTLVSLGGGEGGALPERSEVIGIVLFLLSSFAGAISNVVILKYKSSVKPGVLTSAQLSFGGLLLLILSFIIYKENTLFAILKDFISIFTPKKATLPIDFYLSLVWLIFISSAGFSMWYYLLAKRRESLISMNIWKFIMPVTGGVLGWLIMPDDNPNIKTVVGMLVVALSFLIYYKPDKKKS